MVDFTNKFAIVTGATGGIGRAIAEMLLQSNCKVLVTSTRVIPFWCNKYSNCTYRQLDFLNKQSLDNFLREINKIKNIDILVNNAGIHKPEIIYDVKEDNWDNILKVNLYGPMQTMRVVSLKMKKARHGRILNISSIAGIIARPGANAYSASKSGLIGLTRSSALDLAPYNVLVNALCPGHTQTEMLNRALTVRQRNALKNNIPLKRFAKPLEIANAAVFLCSNLNSYITGQTIIVDGGITIK